MMRPIGNPFNTKIFAKYQVWTSLTPIVSIYARCHVAAKIRFCFTDVKPLCAAMVEPEGIASGLGYCTDAHFPELSM